MVHKARNLAKSQKLKKKLPQNLSPTYQYNQTGNYESEPWPKGDGPGEQGMPYKVLPQFENYAERSVSEYGMNIAVSDAIGMNRTIPDTRLEECKYWDYPTDLPKPLSTRSKGAHEATGEVVLFLDAHCEVGLNWLPPLLTPIQLDNTTMTVPIVDGIDSNDFHYSSTYPEDTHIRGQLSTGERCIVGDNKGVQLVPCELGTVDGPWQYNEENNLMYHTKLGKCLAVHKHNKKLKMLPCIAKSNSFKWIFRSFEPK
ncbi:hypothetical protein QYM36_019509 [Artemia franciscana]|uniref:Polypeptide N-acetylgalactosaminyltransferase n=1 Tax=Artemia franciscana TaxID=6661 RepID=A0AA88HAF9_ARTSF|nr:hypothetical protein QYM36_019509 [Artemia franciscana]